MIKRICIFLMILFHLSSSFATLDDELKKTFAQMSTYTPPGSMSGQDRGVITGGSITVRNKISAPMSIINFQPPSLKAGCGGLDFYGGSLGFISISQFQTLLEGIASNAAGYAFQLAIDVVCPTCAANMKELQKRLQDMSSKINNSCEMAKMITPGSWESAAEKSRKDAEGKVSSVFGEFDDWWRGSTMAKNGKNPVNAFGKMSTQQLKDSHMIGNTVWGAIVDHNVGSFYATSSNDGDFHEILMNLTGTIIVKKGAAKVAAGQRDRDSANHTSTPAVAETAEELASPEVRLIQPEITMKDFMYGFDNKDIWKCNNPAADECMDLTMGPASMKGFIDRVGELLNGTGPGNIGIIAKLRDVANFKTFTAQEVAFIAATSPGILGLLRDFSHDLRAARAISDTVTVFLAQQMAIQFVDEAISNVRYSIDNNRKSVEMAAPEVKKLFDRLDKRKHDAAVISNASMDGVVKSFQVASYMKERLKVVKDANLIDLN